MEKKSFSRVKIYVRDAYNRAGRYAESGNYDQAIQALLPAVCETPEVPLIFERIRQCEIEKCKNTSKAVRFFFQFLSLFTALPIFIVSRKDPVRAMAMCEVQLAKCVDQLLILQILADCSEIAEAPWITVSALEAIREFYPKNDANLRRLATAMQLNNQAGEALSIHRKLAKESSDLAAQNDLRSAMALASIEKGNWDENADIDTAGERKVADDKETIIQQLMEGTIYDAAQAQILIDKFTEDLAKEDSVDMRRKLADAYMITKDFSEAYKQYKLVEEKLGVADPVLDKEIERAYVAKLQQAIDELKAHPDQYESPAEQISQLEGDIASYKLRHAEKRAKDFPKDPTLQLDLAVLHFERGEFDEAEKLFTQVLDTAQTRRTALVYLGRCSILAGKMEDAVKQLEEAVASMYRIDKYKREALYYLAEAATATGNSKRALECYRMIHNSMKNYRDVEEKLAALEKQMSENSDNTQNGEQK